MAQLSAVANVAVPTVPVGSLQAFAGANAPYSWLLCDGSAVSRTQYPDLYSALGTAYGAGDGSTTFNIPDMRGRIPAGKDNMGGTAANRLTTTYFGGTATALGATGGSESHTLTTAQLAAHNHTIQEGSGNSSLLGGNFTGAGQTSTGGGNGSNYYPAQINNTGGGNAHNNTQPTLIVNYIIKALSDTPRNGLYANPAVPIVTSLPTNPAFGDMVIYVADATNGVYWMLQYDASGTYPWKFIGGSALYSSGGSLTTALTTYQTVTGGPSATIPLAGDYFSQYSATVGCQTAAILTSYLGLSVNGSNSVIDAATQTSSGQWDSATIMQIYRSSLAATNVLTLRGKNDQGTGTTSITNLRLLITPIRVSA